MTQLQPLPVFEPAADVLRTRSARHPGTERGAAHRSPLWMTQYRIMLCTLDLCAIIIAITAGLGLHFGSIDIAGHRAYYLSVALGLLVGWMFALQYNDCYQLTHIASGAQEAKRVLRASGTVLIVLAMTGYAFQIPLARGFVVAVVPLGAIALLVLRAGVRQYVADRRDHGAWAHRIVAVGTTESVTRLLDVTKRARSAGLQVVGVCVEDAEIGSCVGAGVPVLGGVLDAAASAAQVDADVVAVTDSGLGPTGVRELGWQLEGTRRGLVMAPTLTEIAGTRMHISPVEGLPLMWLEQPQLGRIPRLLKRIVDIVGAVVLLAVFSPILLLTALIVATTSRGPVFFRQRRFGVNGTEFDILKFRSMYVGAEHRRHEILDLNEQDGGGVLFKMRADPRVTPIGRWLRRYSLDELPQLWHVLTGTMSLVGPRPLAVEDSTYTGHARRRLLVRPGLTGLWQVSGRSDVSWDDVVRMDLYYVENWSLGFDLSILFRTFVAVVGRKGAY